MADQPIQKSVPRGVPGGAKPPSRTGMSLDDPLKDWELELFNELLGPGATVPAGGGGPALIVDDSPQYRDLLATACGLVGLEAVEAGSGGAALKTLTQVRPSLMLLDLMLPEPDGYTVLRGLRLYMKDKDVPVLVTSALDSDQIESDALNLGADAYLIKPFPMTKLEAHLKALLRRAPR